MAAVNFNEYMIYLFVVLRMAGAIFFNPVFGRKNVPAIVKVGLSLGIALCAYQQLSQVQVVHYTALEIVFSMMKELAVGYAIGTVVQLFLAIFHIGGGVMDLQMGLGMASLYDPNTGSQISITGNLITTMFTLLFFITNSHIRFIAIAVKSFQVIPIGFTAISPKIGVYIIELFGFILVYALQLALPLIITQLIVEVAVGILMRVVPNINVFVVNLQVKLGVGVIVILTIIPVLVRYLEKLNTIMLENISVGLQAII
ncbi:MAG TPA: flagellar biosynthetic protein FliR [Anaerovoracaceae bacterium]|nr:flagellar biosynthetic protein FliR [Anaerovoracaceae bacterium]